MTRGPTAFSGPPDCWIWSCLGRLGPWHQLLLVLLLLSQRACLHMSPPKPPWNSSKDRPGDWPGERVLLGKTHQWEMETLACRHTHANAFRTTRSSKFSRKTGNLDFYVKCLDFQNPPWAKKQNKKATPSKKTQTTTTTENHQTQTKQSSQQTISVDHYLLPPIASGMPCIQPKRVSQYPMCSSPGLCTLYVFIQVQSLHAHNRTSRWTFMHMVSLRISLCNIFILQLRRLCVGGLQGCVAGCAS